MKTILNRGQKFKSFVYWNVVWPDPDQNLALLIEVLARANRKTHGFRTFRAAEVALYHTLGALPEPEWTDKFR